MKKLSIILIAVFCFFSAYPRQSQGPPNILWIVSEDNSPFIGAYGDEFANTPHIDNFALQGILYKNAFATAPVCAPARSTLITGVYPNSMGTENMRSLFPIPTGFKFFPKYLREAGYYTTNNAKKDYNTIDQPDAWDESSNTATYKNRKAGQPFFAVFNLMVSHESSLHQRQQNLRHNRDKVPVPPYHPLTDDIKYDWAQYYDKMSEMDEQVGAILSELEAEGLAENTIVFYYSDHGGVLGRSKRFMYESGLHIPLIIRFPEKFQHLAPSKPGSQTDRIVTFADFAPTVLSLAGIPIPEHMQGKPFLGEQRSDEREFAYAFRGRMDERIDLIRSVRNKKYRYIRNYMPHKIYAQYIAYLWKAPHMQSWEKDFLAGNLNEAQARFWQSKTVEELYDIENDPHNINNLSGDRNFQDILLIMREANRNWILEIRDAGFIPEPMVEEISKSLNIFEYARSKAYPIERVLSAAEAASIGNIDEIKKGLDDSNAIVRYWSATGCTIAAKKAELLKNSLVQLLKDPEIAVRIAAAEALYSMGDKRYTIPVLKEALKSGNKMARVQALNVLELMGDDAKPLYQEIAALITQNIQDMDYDQRAAERIISKN